MKIDLGSRLLFGGWIAFFILLFTLDLQSPRSVTRIAAYLAGFLGIWGIFTRKSIKILLEGNIRQGESEIPLYGFEKVVRKYDKRILLALGFIFFGCYTFHFVRTTLEFRDRFYLGERDFVFLGEVILNFNRGLGFLSPFHGDGNSSYLRHHFTPGILAYLPWLEIWKDRIALAWGHLFYSLLALLLWILSFHYEWKKIPQESVLPSLNPVKWFLIWIAFLLGNLYFYRILFSYHYEILFVLGFSFLIFIRNYRQTPERSSLYTTNVFTQILILIFLVTIKEDVPIYLALYFTGEAIWKLFRRASSWKEDTLLMLLSMAYFLGIFPYLREITGNPPDENWYKLWDHWIPPGKTPDTNLDYVIQILRGMVSNPLFLFLELYRKIDTIWEISLGFGFLFYLSPRYFLYLVCVTCIHLLSGREWQNTLYNYFIYSILPVLVYASLEGFRKLAEISQKKNKLSLGFMILALVFYRNSLDASFPYTHANLPIHSAVLESKEYRTNFRRYAIQMKEDLERVESVAAQFDLGIWVPVSTRLYPLKENPMLSDGSYPDCILTNPKTGFSPYIPLEKILLWKQKWKSSHGYWFQKEFGDIHVNCRSNLPEN